MTDIFMVANVSPVFSHNDFITCAGNHLWQNCARFVQRQVDAFVRVFSLELAA